MPDLMQRVATTSHELARPVKGIGQAKEESNTMGKNLLASSANCSIRLFRSKSTLNGETLKERLQQ